MCKIFLEFQETVFFMFSNRFRILNAIWRWPWSSISLAYGCGYARELWRLLLSVLLFPLLLSSPCLGCLIIISKKEQRSAILAEYQRRDVSPNRVPWKEYVLPVSTFPDGLQDGAECIFN